MKSTESQETGIETEQPVEAAEATSPVPEEAQPTAPIDAEPRVETGPIALTDTVPSVGEPSEEALSDSSSAAEPQSPRSELSADSPLQSDSVLHASAELPLKEGEHAVNSDVEEPVASVDAAAKPSGDSS